MEEEDRIRYETLFYCQKLENGFLSGDGARALFIKSKLPLADLTKIWKLADVTHDNRLDVFEFSLAMYLMELKLCGLEIPKQLDQSLLQNAKTDVIISKMTKKEEEQLQKIFEHKDTNCQGYLERDVVHPMMLASGLPPLVLSKIWSIADFNRDAKLSFLEFAVAFHILKDCVKGLSLDGPVNPFLCFSDKETAILSCKRKLAIFNKDLLEQKKRRKEDSFLNSNVNCELNDIDFDMMVQYLSPAVLTKVIRPQYVIDENSNKSDNSNEHFDSVEVNELENDGPEGLGFSPEEKNERFYQPVDTFERDRVTSNELSIDLDSVFEMVERESSNDCDEGPKYIARPAVWDGVEDESDEDIAVLTKNIHRRTYVGKQLIFEDPIGSETIGDVEFEVDFDSIISDIEKESVDEERRLPIARVLPIYKAPPVTSEPPVEKKTTKKDILEVDWNLVADYNMKSEISDSTKDSIASSKKGNNSGSVNKDNETWQTGILQKENTVSVFQPESSADHNFLQIQNLKNWKKDREEDEMIDIVEQKRMIVANQVEERKKSKEMLMSSETINFPNTPSNLAIENPSPKEGIEKSGKVATYRNTELERNKEQLVDPRSFSESETTKTFSQPENQTTGSLKQDVAFAERNMTEPTGLGSNIINYRTTYTSEETSARTFDEKLEERRQREAEHKEKLLLERIERLERKRKELLAKKQREEELKNIINEQKLAGGRNRLVGEGSMKVMPNTTTVNHFGNKHEKKMNSNVETGAVDVWSQNSGQLQGDSHDDGFSKEEERKRLALALEEKRKREAESQKRREEELRAAEKRHMEEMAKQEEERQAAEERKRHFLENLEKLKQRVVSEEAEKSGLGSKTKRGPLKSMASVVSQAMDVQLSAKQHETVKHTHKYKATESQANKQPTQSNEKDSTKPQTDIQSILSTGNDYAEVDEKKQQENLNQMEEKLKEDEIRRQNFKSNRELFMNRVESEKEAKSQVAMRNMSKKARPKSYYGGMFSKPVHQIIDDSLLTPNKCESMEDLPDFVDEEALKQFKREQELKKEHEKMVKHRHTLDRETSYTVENVEKLWEIDTDVQPQSEREESKSLEQKQARASTNPHRRSLVDTLTTEWNSFLDILEEDKRRESETVKIRQEISAQEEDTQIEKNDLAIIKPRDHERTVVIETTPSTHPQLKRQDPLDANDTVEMDIKRQQQKRIIKDNAPKRKSDLAHAWSNVVSRQ